MFVFFGLILNLSLFFFSLSLSFSLSPHIHRSQDPLVACITKNSTNTCPDFNACLAGRISRRPELCDHSWVFYLNFGLSIVLLLVGFVTLFFSLNYPWIPNGVSSIDEEVSPLLEEKSYYYCVKCETLWYPTKDHHQPSVIPFEAEDISLAIDPRGSTDPGSFPFSPSLASSLSSSSLLTTFPESTPSYSPPRSPRSPSPTDPKITDNPISQPFRPTGEFQFEETKTNGSSFQYAYCFFHHYQRVVFWIGIGCLLFSQVPLFGFLLEDPSFYLASAWVAGLVLYILPLIFFVRFLRREVKYIPRSKVFPKSLFPSFPNLSLGLKEDEKIELIGVASKGAQCGWGPEVPFAQQQRYLQEEEQQQSAREDWRITKDDTNTPVERTSMITSLAMCSLLSGGILSLGVIFLFSQETTQSQLRIGILMALFVPLFLPLFFLVDQLVQKYGSILTIPLLTRSGLIFITFFPHWIYVTRLNAPISSFFSSIPYQEPPQNALLFVHTKPIPNTRLSSCSFTVNAVETRMTEVVEIEEARERWISPEDIPPKKKWNLYPGHLAASLSPFHFEFRNWEKFQKVVSDWGWKVTLIRRAGKGNEVPNNVKGSVIWSLWFLLCIVALIMGGAGIFYSLGTKLPHLFTFPSFFVYLIASFFGCVPALWAGYERIDFFSSRFWSSVYGI